MAEETVATDIWEMLESICAYVKQTGKRHRVVSEDNPFELRLGFRADRRVWQIRLSDIKRSLGSDPEKAKVVGPFLQTREGRDRLAEALSLGVIPS